jgi:hypothetical protein
LQIALGERLVGLLDETPDRIAALATVAAVARRADLDVAVARFRAARQHAERDDRAFLCVTRRACDRVLERADVDDHVIGRHHREHRIVRERARVERGERERGRRVARRRLEQDARRRGTVGHLRSAERPMLFATDEQQRVVERRVRDAVQTTRGRRQRRFVRRQLDQLLRKLLARQRPEARAGAAGEDHGKDARQRGIGDLAKGADHRLAPESAASRP